VPDVAALHDLTALEAAAAIRAGELSAADLVAHALDRVARLDGRLGAFVTVTAAAAQQQAVAADAMVRAHEKSTLPPLLGVPTAIKDLNLTKGVPTKLGSATSVDFVPSVDDHIVELLRAAGTISLGKTATPEFGLPCYTESDIGPPARNPWDPTRLSGGSSGGAATAVAAGLVPIAQGSDGGGSIRIPASLCGLVGLKPTRGRVSRGPLDLDATRLGVFGGLTRTVRDAAVFLDVVSVPQPGDPDRPPSLPAGETFLGWCDRDPGRLRIGRYLDSPIPTEVDPQVHAAWERTSQLLSDLGHEVVDVRAPVPPDAIPHFETVWSVSAATAPVAPGQEDLLRPLTRSLRRRGAEISGTRFAEALAQLALYSRRGVAAHAAYDAVLVPTVAKLAPTIGYFDGDGDPVADFERQKRFTPYTAIYNTTGQPAISVPLHQSAEGLPIGMMFAGRPGAEATLLCLAAQLEATRPWRDRRPPIWED
jgi:amidase